MAYGKIRIDWKQFFMGFGALALCLVLPGISGVFSNMIETVRNALPFGKTSA
jgi:hypothetical protein